MAKKNSIVKITIEYKQKPAYGNKSWSVDLVGADTFAVITDPDLADAIFRLGGITPGQGKPGNANGPHPKLLKGQAVVVKTSKSAKTAKAAKAAKTSKTAAGSSSARKRPLVEPGEDPECCYFINGKWVCW